MEIIKARIEQKKNIYVHDDLSQAASLLKQVIDNKNKTDDRDGLAFYGMACAVMLAFTFEAKINFLGHTCCKTGKKKKNNP
jgi:hypothetical protein